MKLSEKQDLKFSLDFNSNQQTLEDLQGGITVRKNNNLIYNSMVMQS